MYRPRLVTRSAKQQMFVHVYCVLIFKNILILKKRKIYGANTRKSFEAVLVVKGKIGIWCIF